MMKFRSICCSCLLAVSAAALAQISFSQPKTLPTPRFICRLKDGADVFRIARTYRLSLVDRTQNAPFALFQPKFTGDHHPVQEQMRLDPEILWVEDDAVIDTPEGQAAKGGTIAAVGGIDGLYEMNDGFLNQINWSEALANAAGRNVTVAVLDTGLSPHQVELWTRVVVSANFVEKGSQAYDLPYGTDSNANGFLDEGAGHGTMVAGLLSILAPRVDLAIARIADSDGHSSAWLVVKGLAFAVNSGAEVANISLGSIPQIVALSDTMNWCEEKNLLVVAPVGNDDADRARYPARIGKVVAIAGLLPDDTKAPFSNWDGSTDSCAPATGLVGPWWDDEYYAIWSGTSFASPMAAAGIANALRRTTPKDAGDLEDALRTSGQNINHLNLPYADQLGTKLDFVNLDLAIRSLN
ncbi:MAG: hypothetical protein HONBIEJF_02687 [Fimbriimonadaceae bacterium]|nr:hypothetical protein [Fimbriimonadaceae bacterium]